MFTSKRTTRQIPARTVFSAIAMLIGVILLSYGYYGEIRSMLYTGLIMILGGVLTEIMFTILRKS